MKLTDKDVVINHEAKLIEIQRYKSPLMHHAKWVERLQAMFPDYTVVPPAK